MDIANVETTVAKIFREKLAQLKKGERVDIEFYLFFEDGFWMIPANTKLEKDHNYLILSMVINKFKPSHYAIVSDTNVRDYHTMKILFEQLMASVTNADGITKTILQPYDRLPNGKIKLTRPRVAMDGAQMTGIATELFDNLAEGMPEFEARQNLMDMFEQKLAAEKRPYDDTQPA